FDQAQDLVRVARLARAAGDLRNREPQRDRALGVIRGDGAPARQEAQRRGVDAGLVEVERRVAGQAAAGELEARVVGLDAVADVAVDHAHLRARGEQPSDAGLADFDVDAALQRNFLVVAGELPAALADAAAAAVAGRRRQGLRVGFHFELAAQLVKQQRTEALRLADLRRMARAVDDGETSARDGGSNRLTDARRCDLVVARPDDERRRLDRPQAAAEI